MPAIVVAIASLLFAFMLAHSAYRYGMFFDVNFYKWEWVMMSVAVGWAVAAETAGRIRIRRQTKSPTLGLSPGSSARASVLPGWSSVPAEAYGPVAISLLYGLSLLNEPASVLGTIEQAIRWSAYAAFLMTGYMWFGSGRHPFLLGAALQAAGLFVIGGALAGWMGWISFPEMIMFTGDNQLSSVGARLAGFMQYPNLLGTVAGAYLIWQWLLLARAGSRAAFISAAVLVIPAALTLLLTESRGAWLSAAAGWLAGLLLVTRPERVKWLIYSAWTVIGAGAAYRFALEAGLRSGGAAGAAGMSATVLLLAVLLTGAAGFAVIRAAVSRRSGRRLEIAAWGGWSGAIAALALILPSVIHGRLSGHFQTAGARSMFYRDAWLLFREAPLLGRGGDTWRMLFTRIQTYPYIGNEVHSGYLDMLLNLGLIGLIVFIIGLGLLLRRVWMRDRTGVVPIGLLLIHAAVDFDMSFGYYWLLLFSWIIYYSAGPLPGGDQVAVKPLWRTGGNRAYTAQIAVALTAVALFTAAAAYGWRFDRAVQHRAEAVALTGEAQAASLRSALSANPYWSRIRIELAQLAPPQERAALLAAGLRYEPQSVPLLRALGRSYAERGDAGQAAAYLRLALRYDHYDRDNQTTAIVTMNELAQNMRAAERPADARYAAETALAFFAAFQSQGEAAKRGGRDFDVTPESKAAAAASRRLLNELAPA
ncbi:O-antigen ligase family protein [Paenibacillus sp. sptzw28]|uniref:O-antigen ligase family protein n=1 Tax=Paenibacillus sp. sptzw28 TaxID=715179 RepID=UPI001C6F5879|nr:O-antigen ligase family protein [Paenibacillus sp. sptzw28]QYR20567.1 O-antigen ligase family protein [Paenibacillus sp. sptzw28]